MSKTRAVNIRRDKYDVYIGRAGHGFDGYFGNPIKVGYKCPVCGNAHEEGWQTLPCFSIYFSSRVNNDPIFRSRVLQLRGLRLGCFCYPKKPCHGTIMANWIDSQPFQES